MEHPFVYSQKKEDLPLSTLHKVFVAPVLHKMTTGSAQEKTKTKPAMAEE